MSDTLTIEFDWLDAELADDVETALAASIGIAVGDQYVTRLDDLRARTVRNHMRGSAWHLAAWFAVNWWRLRWEPASFRQRLGAEWRMAHSVAGAGGGFVWPDAIFASDGETINIRSKPNPRSASFEPIRYLEEVDGRIAAVEFERKVDEFVSGVLSRLDFCRVSDQRLAELWKEVLAERRQPKTRRRRKLEAIAGYDPDDAPDAVIKQLIQDKERLGKDALEEVAAAMRHETGEALGFFHQLTSSGSEPSEGGFRGELPDSGNIPRIGSETHLPWQRATELARTVRSQWGFGNKPILNKHLAGLIGAKPEIFSDSSVAKVPMPFALRSKTSQSCDFYFDRGTPTTRRFAVGRFIGDYLDSADTDRLLPVTDMKTARQKFQRVFAQEFLCPIDALLEKMQTSNPGANDVEAAADYFHVSPLMVRTTLVNTGHLDRGALNWQD